VHAHGGVTQDGLWSSGGDRDVLLAPCHHVLEVEELAAKRREGGREGGRGREEEEGEQLA
jgi:hypothetical protein